MQKNQIIFVGFYILGSSLALYTEIKELNMEVIIIAKIVEAVEAVKLVRSGDVVMIGGFGNVGNPKRLIDFCLLYTSPSPRDRSVSRMPSSA